MCNLYRMTSSVDAIKQLFGPLSNDRTNLQSYEAVYPDQQAPVITHQDDRSLELMTWGVPGWKEGMRPITNVRNLQSSFWKSMLARPENRCLVPVTAFCEWKGEKGSKEKVWFEVTEQKLFSFAGIWRQTDNGPRYAFLTCEPNKLVGEIHPKAMPVILHADSHDKWLQGSYDDAVSMAQPYPDAQMAIIK